MKTFSLIVALSFVAGHASAWGPVGHMAVGMIAEARLSPKTSARVRELLGATTLDQISNCADSFGYGRQRDCAGTFEIPGDFNESKPWHYIDIDVELDGVTNAMEHCPKQGCAIPAIEKNLAVLADPSAAKHQKQLALMWVTHFVGDIHQPLHCAEHHHDEGGNKKRLDVVYGKTRDGKPKYVNLHTAWDHAIYPPYRVSFGEPHPQLIGEARKLTEKLSAQLLSEDASTWAAAPNLTNAIVLESWRIAKDKLYPGYFATGGKVADAAGTGYSEAYVRESRHIAEKRVKMAGWRLAAMLEQTLGR